MAAKRKVQLKCNTYTIVERAVEEGVVWGWNRAHKHTDTPSEEYIKEQIAYYVMLSLEEAVKF